MNILITGYRGFIGSHLVATLRSEMIENHGDGKEITNNLHLLAGDILETASPPFVADSDIDVLVHLAAKPSVPYSIEQPWESFKTNVAGTLRMLEICRDTGARFVFASSSQASPDAMNPYGLQKYMCEQLIKQYGKLYQVPYCILRFYNVFGEGEHGVIGRFQRAAERGDPLEVWGGFQRRDFVHVDTVVKYLMKGINGGQGIFEIGSGTTWSIKEIADMISDNQIPMPMAEGQPMETRCPTPVETISVPEYIEVWKNH